MGSNDSYVIKNIYDLAVNVTEWAMEEGGKDERVRRGRYFGDNGKKLPASSSGFDNPSNYLYGVGFRITLYLRT